MTSDAHLLLIEQKTRELGEEKRNIAQVIHNIDQRKHDLEVRENKLLELEPLIPSVKQLRKKTPSFPRLVKARKNYIVR